MAPPWVPCVLLGPLYPFGLRFVGCLTGLFAVGELLAEAERLTGSGQAAALIPRAVPQDHAKALSSERDRALLSAFQALAALAVWARAQPAPPDDPSALRVWLTVRFLVSQALASGQRWSVIREREVLLRLLRRESVDVVSRKLRVESCRLGGVEAARAAGATPSCTSGRREVGACMRGVRAIAPPMSAESSGVERACRIFETRRLNYDAHLKPLPITRPPQGGRAPKRKVSDEDPLEYIEANLTVLALPRRGLPRGSGAAAAKLHRQAVVRKGQQR